MPRRYNETATHGVRFTIAGDCYSCEIGDQLYAGSGMHPISAPSGGDLVLGRRVLGDFELTFCTDGPFLLDGGAMFGVVPKPLWSRRTPADDQNRVLLGTNCVVVRTGKAVVLLETGIGNKQGAKMRAIHANCECLPQSLAAAGVLSDEITHVVNTHLHFDHCGWNTTQHADGKVTPTFPNARYFCAAGELAHGRLQLDRDRVSYLAPNYDPLIAAGQLTLLDPAAWGAIRWMTHACELPETGRQRCRLFRSRPRRRLSRKFA